MKFFGYELRKSKKPEERNAYNEYYSSIYGGISYGTHSAFAASKALTLSACYRAVNLISDAIASLQLKVYQVDKEGFKTENHQSPLYTILGWEPNPTMSRFNFFKLIITSILLRGNAFIKIYRDDKFAVTGLEILNPDTIVISKINGDIKYMQNGVRGMTNSSDMIHIVNYPQIGSLYGVSTITYAANSLEIAYNSEMHAGNWFKGGANASGFLSTNAPLTPKQEQDLVNKFKNASDPTTGNPNGIVIMGGAGDIQLRTLGVSPRDSQLLESRQFNVLDIARFFNVNPILLFDNTKATYNNIENAQLDFLNTTLLPIIEKLENEFTRKLILPSQRHITELRFDLNNLLRADMNSQADYFTKLFSIGVVNANYVAKSLNLPKNEGDGGSRYYVSTNLQDTNNLIVNQNNSIDNKLKDSDENDN
jgi:HK97 family phage portal protein